MTPTDFFPQTPNVGDEEPNSETIRCEKVRARWFSPVKNGTEASAETPSRPGNFDYSFNVDALNLPLTANSTQGAYSLRATEHLTKLKADAVSNSPRSLDVDCELCARRCRIAPGKTGFCSARFNDDGVLRTRFYGRPVSLALDPIEKKPLYHFLPGTPILSVGTFGCTLACRFCQNWKISRSLPVGETIRNVLEPAEIVETALARRCPNVAFTYNEPTVWAEYVVDVAKRCRRAGIKTVAVTNGTIVGKAREEFFDAVDAANVDLKAFSSDFYRSLTNGSFEAVKETLQYIAKNTNVWLEITNLLIPTKNDSPEELTRLADWIAETIGTETPLHFSAFFPTHRLTDVPPTPPETLVAAEKIARKAGLRYVYRGNVDDNSGQTTRCPTCEAPLIIRERYSTKISTFLVNQDAAPSPTRAEKFQRFCGNCGTPIAGVFE